VAADVLPTSATELPSVPPGAVFAHLVVPATGVNDFVVEGVASSQLAEGPGHCPGIAAIGSSGNVAIAGHRTTHTAPFYNLNELAPGDLVYLTNLVGHTFTYRVTSQFVIEPNKGANIRRLLEIGKKTRSPNAPCCHHLPSSPLRTRLRVGW
jgi:LPXTG-site transpeptidase (sortase) family protein